MIDYSKKAPEQQQYKGKTINVFKQMYYGNDELPYAPPTPTYAHNDAPVASLAYPCVISDVSVDATTGKVLLYTQIEAGNYANVFGPHDERSVVYLQYDPTISGKNLQSMTRKRLAALATSNPNAGVYDIWNSGQYERLIGLKIGVIYELKQLSNMTYAVPMTRLLVPYNDIDMSWHNGNTATYQPGVVFVDSRQKEGQHDGVHAVLSQMGHKLETPKAGLCVGDYSSSHSSYVVDTKGSVDELADNLSSQIDRFKREVERAQKMGLHLIIVVRAGEYARDIYSWIPVQCRYCTECAALHNERSAVCSLTETEKPLSAIEVSEAMNKLMTQYPDTVKFEFVETDEECAKRINYYLFEIENN